MTTVRQVGRTAMVRSTPRPRSRRVLRLLPMAPAVALMAVFFVGPVVGAVYISTTNTALTGPYAANPTSVGWQNFHQALTDPAVHTALLRTVIFVVACVAAQNGLGLALVLLMQHRLRAVRALVSAIVVGAWVIPEVVAAFVWYTFLQSDGGTLNQLIGLLSLPGQTWLVTSPLLSVILANVWRGSAFSMLVYNAALQDVPGDILEAADMDGASYSRRTWHIVLPTMRRSAAANLLLTTLSTLGVFGLIWAMTAGGPADRSQTLPVLMYQEAFTFSKLGYGSAIALLLLALGAVFAFVYMFMLRAEKR